MCNPPLLYFLSYLRGCMCSNVSVASRLLSHDKICGHGNHYHRVTDPWWSCLLRVSVRRSQVKAPAASSPWNITDNIWNSSGSLEAKLGSLRWFWTCAEEGSAVKERRRRRSVTESVPSGVKWTHFSMLSEHSTFILPRNIWPMSGPNVLVWFAVTRVTWSMRVDHPEDDYEVTWDSSSVVLDLRKPLDGSETPLWTKGSPLTTLSPAAPGGHHRRETTRCPRWHNTTTPFIQTRDHKLTKTEQVIKTEEII